jgi:mycothiol synthase
VVELVETRCAEKEWGPRSDRDTLTSVDDLSIRPPTRADAAAIADHLRVVEEVDQTGEHYSTDDVVELLENPMIDPKRDWVLAQVAGEIVASTLLMPRAPADGVVDVSVVGEVHPAHRGRGIGSTLLPMMVARAKEYVAEQGEGLSAVLRAHAISDDQGAAELFESLGFVPMRWNFLMEADLSLPSPEQPTEMPEGYAVHTWEGIDHDEIRAAHNAAFGGHHYGFTPWDAQMWEQWVSASRSYRPALSLVARSADGAIAAYVQTAEYDAVAETTGVREAFVAKVGTTPDHRRRGLASALLAQCIELYREHAFDRSALDVDSENPSGALGVYERAGFEVKKKFTLYELD